MSQTMNQSVAGGNMSATLQRWGKQDTQWMLALFATALGAGILFLPINAGLGGIWPLFFLAALVGPMTFLAHRGLARFCLSSSKKDGDIIDAVNEHFGETGGTLINLGYFLSIAPILMIYGTGITNTVASFMEHQLMMDVPPRAILSLVLVGGLISVMLTGRERVLKITSLIVYPLIAVLLCVSFYLVPQWTTAQFDATITAGSFLKTVFLTIPVLVFAFNHSPAISSFSQSYRSRTGDMAEQHASRTLKRTTMLLVCFVMFFVFSCVLTLSPEQLQAAKDANLSILSYFALVSDNQLFAWIAQIVAIVAITGAFFGHFMGTQEGLNGLVTKAITRGNPAKEVSNKSVSRISTVIIFAVVWGAAYLDLSVMAMIEALVAPVLACILFIMPVYAVKRVPSLKRFDTPVNLFTLLMGAIAISGFIISKVM